MSEERIEAEISFTRNPMGPMFTLHIRGATTDEFREIMLTAGELALRIFHETRNEKVG